MSLQRSKRALSVFAHRGYSSKYPDNTLLSFQKAIEVGADYIEFDVRRTKDNVLVVFHDSFVKDSSGTKKRIEDMVLDEVKKIKLEEDQHIPLLEEVLELCKGKIGLQIELKGVGVAEPTLDMIKRFGLEEDAFYSAFNEVEIWRIMELCPSCYCAVVIDAGRYVSPSPLESFKWMLYKAKKMGVPTVHVPFNVLDEGMVELAHNEGLKINVWTVDAPLLWDALLEMGVDGIFTNNPEGLIAMLENPHD